MLLCGNRKRCRPPVYPVCPAAVHSPGLAADFPAS
ncbi:hypothetical protein EVA_14433 [gut metagenome]|uniref:Uncharacterized protein n=1 Tax=gut metagenome TaxID=749906 RepID=J9FR77_9ZZZZ